jgi:DNA-binding transcriptional LysR family regulator
MEWDDMRVLLALLHAENLHDAGGRLGLDASTVSRRLSSLETRLGARLFMRTRQGLRPTAAAERLRPHAERMEVEAEAVVKVLRAGDPRVTGLVRVATTEAFARILAAEGLLRVCQEHAELTVELLGGNHPVDLARGEADVAVRVAGLKQPSLRAQCVGKTPVALFAASSYLRARGPVRTVAGLRGHDVLLPTGELSRLPEARWLASRPGIRVTLRSNSMPALVAAAAAGHGVVPLPAGWGDSEPALERVLDLEAIPKRKVWLVAHESALERPAVRVVQRELAAICGRLFGR